MVLFLRKLSGTGLVDPRELTCRLDILDARSVSVCPLSVTAGQSSGPPVAVALTRLGQPPVRHRQRLWRPPSTRRRDGRHVTHCGHAGQGRHGLQGRWRQQHHLQPVRIGAAEGGFCVGPKGGSLWSCEERDMEESRVAAGWLRTVWSVVCALLCCSPWQTRQTDWVVYWCLSWSFWCALSVPGAGWRQYTPPHLWEEHPVYRGVCMWVAWPRWSCSSDALLRPLSVGGLLCDDVSDASHPHVRHPPFSLMSHALAIRLGRHTSCVWSFPPHPPAYPR